MDEGDFPVQVVKASSHEQTFHDLLDLLGRDVLLELYLLLDSFEDQFLLICPFDVAAKNSLNSEHLLLFFDFLRPVECLLEDFHGHPSADPHFSASINRCCIVDSTHHELS